jgi:hypothetical protein
MRTNEKGGHREHKAIECCEIGRARSGAVDDQKLLLEQQRFRGDGTGAAAAEKFC